MAGTLDFEFRFGKGKKTTSFDRRLRILVLADLSGQRERSTGLAERLPLAVDIDNIAKTMARISPRLLIDLETPQGAAEQVELTFTHLNDLHPDALFRHSEAFAAQRGWREDLVNPERFQRTASALGLPTQAAAPQGESDADTLARLFGKTSSQPVSATASALNRLVRDVVPSRSVNDNRDLRKRVMSEFDAQVAQRMRSLLRHPAFQQLEATWRGVWQLASELESGEEVEVCILDVSREELQAELLENSGATLRGILSAAAREGGPWSLLIGDFSFADTLLDVGMLTILAKLASQAEAPFLAAAQPALVGSASLEQLDQPAQWRPLASEVAESWQALRKSSNAQWLGLSMPRLLARLPYGRATEPVESFAFEEMADASAHENFLWVNPAYAQAGLLDQAFSEDGWDMAPAEHVEIGSLPSFVYRDKNGESRQKPCAEVMLSEPVANTLLGRGIMPLLSYRSRDAVRLLRWQSVASPARPLAGVFSD